MRKDWTPLIGKSFGSLTVDEVFVQGGFSFARCRCRCGSECVKRAYKIGSPTMSCGCERYAQANITRAKTISQRPRREKGSVPCETGAYKTWLSMRVRCYSPKHRFYHRYGGRGITVCDRWQDFKAFYEDMGDRPEGMTIDRIDGNGNYEPGNCRWATPEQQAFNMPKTIKIEIDGIVDSRSGWARRIGISTTSFLKRMRRGQTPQYIVEAVRAKRREVEIREVGK